MVDAVGLNADAHSALIDRAALDSAISAQGAEFQAAITDAHAHLFADVAVFVTSDQVKQMQAVITAVEEVVKFQATVRPELVEGVALGVFYGYDFHLNAQGAHLIEINTNAGGAFLNALLIESQCESLPFGASPVHTSTSSVRTDTNFWQAFLDMFLNEWRLAHGDAPLRAIAIVDEQPESQYLYPEFLLAKAMFERAGINAHIVDPSALQARGDGLYMGEQKIDLIYNRLTDFSLQQFPHIRHAHEKQQVVLTPNPSHYQRYADKRKLAWLTDDVLMRSTGVPQATIDVLLQGIPQTKLVNAVDTDQWWAERKQWFFKPVNGYGSKGAYRGDKITKRVFEEIMSSDYVAQKMAVPGERSVSLDDEVVSLKYDVRCYVYDGQIQLISARLYRGQTTNFRTIGGGFALVLAVE